MATKENQFFIDSEYLSTAALERKHQLETDPSSRKSHMEYLPGMEQIQSDVRENVMSPTDGIVFFTHQKPLVNQKDLVFTMIRRLHA